MTNDALTPFPLMTNDALTPFPFIEMASGSSAVLLKEYVWGVMYVDELVQVAHSTNTTAPCEVFYQPCHDANFSVTQLLDSDGALVERYVYTPYGQRYAFKVSSAETSPYFGTYAIKHSQPVVVQGTVEQPYGICDIGHQGLMYDKEIDLYYNRARYLDPTLGRFIGRDPKQYIDGNNLYEYLRGNPLNGRDPMGAERIEVDYTTKSVWWVVEDQEDGKSVDWVWLGRFRGSRVVIRAGFARRHDLHNGIATPDADYEVSLRDLRQFASKYWRDYPAGLAPYSERIRRFEIATALARVYSNDPITRRSLAHECASRYVEDVVKHAGPRAVACLKGMDEGALTALKALGNTVRNPMQVVDSMAAVYNDPELIPLAGIALMQEGMARFDEGDEAFSRFMGKMAGEAMVAAVTAKASASLWKSLSKTQRVQRIRQALARRLKSVKDKVVRKVKQFHRAETGGFGPDLPDIPDIDAPKGGAGQAAKRMTPDQKALHDLAKEAKLRGRTNPIDADDAATLRQWADEYGVPSRRPEVHPNRPVGKKPHIHIGNVKHIPVQSQ